jgi:hypothetical protein
MAAGPWATWHGGILAGLAGSVACPRLEFLFRHRFVLPLNPLDLLASPAGFEPTAPRLGIWCSILLSYGDGRACLAQAAAPWDRGAP